MCQLITTRFSIHTHMEVSVLTILTHCTSWDYCVIHGVCSVGARDSANEAPPELVNHVRKIASSMVNYCMCVCGTVHLVNNYRVCLILIKWKCSSVVDFPVSVGGPLLSPGGLLSGCHGETCTKLSITA